MSKYLICFLFICCSCSSFEQEQLEKALEFASSNRAELEKVLHHYEQDSLKLEAAKFLIRNMPHCYFYQQGGEMDSVKRVRTYYSPFGQIDQTYAKQWGHYTYRNLPKIYDAHVITAKYLIDNIDHAFDNWQKRPWNHSLSFEDFCEYLLPYRLGDEPLEEWRELYEKEYGYLLDSIYTSNDVVEAANLIGQHLLQPVFIYCEDFELPHIGPRYLFKHRYGSCVDAADIITYTFRAVGIPCMEDTDARGGHVWNVIRDGDEKDVPIWYIGSEAVRGSRDTGGYKRGKAYRYMYGFQKEKVKKLGEDWQSMPLLFYHPYMKDVSYEYYPDTLRMPTDFPDSEPYYLAHFHEARWWSCAYTRPVNGRIEILPTAVWGSPTEEGNEHVLVEHVTDEDPLSYYLSLDKGGEAVIDLGKPVEIDYLEYMPRNDDNFIAPGDTYELFYHAGTKGWKSLGMQRAETTYLDWEVPDNALFWLRDLTRGREEHIFFMQNGQQKFPTF